jgi:predicted dehydrogenase
LEEGLFEEGTDRMGRPSLLTTFDVKGGSMLPRIEVYGSEGTLLVPDPNTFGGPVSLYQAGKKEWTEIPLTHGKSENARGVGAADMAKAILSGRKHRANGAMTYHVLEAMHGFHDASDKGVHYLMQSTCERPAPLPSGLADHELD